MSQPAQPYDQGQPYDPFPMPRGEGHDYVISPLPRHEESMYGTYPKQNLAEESYVPATHDHIVDRYVRLGPAQGGAPHQTPFYAPPRTPPHDDGTGAPRPVGV